MEELSFLLNAEGLTLYVFIAAALLGGAVGLPIPEDLPLIVAGKLVADGRISLAATLLVCYCAIIIGDVIIFSLGYFMGKKLFKNSFFRKRFSDSKVKEIKSRLERHSLSMIFIARHLFYLRTLTFLTCGAFRMKFSRFILADAFAAMVSAPLMLTIGYVTADYIDAAFTALSQIKTVSLYAGIAVLLLGLLIWFRKKRIAAESESDDPAGYQ